MAQIGQIIDGKFRILEPVGRGGMSRVYLAQDIHLEKRWVVKEIPKFVNGGKNTLFIQAALSEAEIIKGLDHPCIVRIVDIAQDAGAVYIVEDYVEGRSLKEIADTEEEITPPEFRDWAIQLCQVLIYLHSRKPAVIYRDLKPENIILTETGHIKLVDFGIARRYRQDGDRDTVYLGTVQFAAPEQYEEYGAQTDRRTDIYGYGKTLEYLAYYCPDLSEEVLALIRMCIREEPRDRYQSAEELLQDLLRIRDFRRARTGPKTALRIVLALSSCVLLLLAAVRMLKGPDRDPLSEILDRVEEIRADMIFSSQEEEELLNMIMPHLEELQEREGFEETAFAIGTLYRDCYGYGSDGYAGLKEAASWFELAGDDNDTARISGLLGRYLAEANELDPAASGEGAYRSSMEQLIHLAAQAAAGDPEASLRSEVCRIAADALAANVYQYRNDGVSLKDAELLMSHIGRMISRIREQEESGGAADRLQEKLELAGRAVSDAYS